MDLTEKTRDELMAIAVEKGLKPHHKTGEARLRTMIEELDKEPDEAVTAIDTESLKNEDVVGVEAIEKRFRMEEAIRDKLRLEAQIRDGIAEVKAGATLAHVTLDIPESPTLADVIQLKKQLGIEVKKPKSSPETLAIEASKKMYYIFRNLEERGVDVKHCVGGKYWFHHFDGKLSVLPDYLVTFFRKHCTIPITERRPAPDGKGEVTVVVGREPRFSLELIGEAPEDAPFGVILDNKILDKFGLLQKEAPQ